MAKKKSGASSKLRLLKIPATLYLEPEQAEALKALSESTRVPQQVYLREGVDLVLAHYRHVAGLIAGGSPEPPRPPPVLERLIRAAGTAPKEKGAAHSPAKHK